MTDYKINWFYTPHFGYRRTSVSYKDDQGKPVATQLNGHLMLHEVKASIENHQKRVKAQIESGNYYT